jgi:hypothetical protein
MKLTKEELQKQLNQIRIEEEKNLIEENYPQFKKYEGRYYKIENTYGGKQFKKWGVFTKVIAVKPEYVYNSGDNILCRCDTFSFQTCTENRFLCGMK